MCAYFLLDPYYLQERIIREIFERNGTIFSHRGFPGQSYNRNLSSSIIRIKDLNSTVGKKAVVFVKFTSKFDIFGNTTMTFCGGRDDRLHIGDDRSHQWIDYCNNKKPPLDVWIPHSSDSNKFFFWLACCHLNVSDCRGTWFPLAVFW